jgi:hypothetical protein
LSATRCIGSNVKDSAKTVSSINNWRYSKRAMRTAMQIDLLLHLETGLLACTLFRAEGACYDQSHIRISTDWVDRLDDRLAVFLLEHSLHNLKIRIRGWRVGMSLDFCPTGRVSSRLCKRLKDPRAP